MWLCYKAQGSWHWVQGQRVKGRERIELREWKFEGEKGRMGEWEKWRKRRTYSIT